MIPTRAPVGAGVVPIQTWTPPRVGEATTFRYVDIGSVDRETKTLVGATELRVIDAPSRARQLLRKDDVLVSTVRPNLNAVAMVPAELDGAVGSTGFAVLRANPKRLLPRYLFHWVRTPMFVAEMVKRATGASYPAVSDRIVLDSRVPMPAVDEQRRIADILDQVDAIRGKRRLATALTAELLRSAFLEMFGDPVSNPRGWPIMSVTDLCESKQYGTAEKANSEMRGTPVLRMNNLTYAGELDLTDLKWVELPPQEADKLDLREGDVLFNRTNSHDLVGKTAAWHGGSGFTFAGYLIRLRIRKNAATADYVAAAMNTSSVKRELLRMAKPSINMSNISGSDLDRLRLPVPPVSVQKDYVAFRNTVAQVRARCDVASSLDGELFNSLVARAFSGALNPTEAAC